MSNLNKFLTDYSTCPICNDNIFTEIMIIFDAFTKRGAVRFDLNINYVRDMGATNCFKYIKYRDDNDRGYNPGFDRASNGVVISKNGSFILDSNMFAPESYLVYGHCSHDHFLVETKIVSINSEIKEDKIIRICKEEIQIKNYRIVNDYSAWRTKIYVDEKFPAKLDLKLTPFCDLKKNKADIVQKIESLLILSS